MHSGHDPLRRRRRRLDAVRCGAVVLLAAALSPASSAPRLVEQDEWILQLRPLTAAPAAGEPSSVTLRVSRADEATAVARVAWPERGETTSVLFRARILDADATGSTRIVLAARAMAGEGPVLEAERGFEPSDSATLIFEVGRHGKSRPLTFSVGVELERRPVIVGPASPGAPVQLQLEVQRVLDGRIIPTETNTLNTFVGESVSYGFRIGDAAALQAFEIRLRPIDLVGETAILDIEIAGALPGTDRFEIVGRRESWFTSRDAVSTLAIESGDPPTGWRFLVTPRF